MLAAMTRADDDASDAGGASAAAAAFALPVPALGAWRAGNTGTEGVWSFAAAGPGPSVLVTALVHGNELCGAWAVLGALQAGLRPRRGRLTLAFCNLQAFDRFDAGDDGASRFLDEDLNRVWGDGLAARPASREQRRALALRPFVEAADWLLDLHSMTQPGPPLMLTGLLPRNVALARRLAMPRHVVVDAGHANGRRMRDHGRFGAADAEALALLLECGQHGELAARDVAFDGLARFLACSGVVDVADIPASWTLPTQPGQRVLEVTEAVVARSADVRFASAWQTGQTIAEAGTVLGWNDGEPFCTPYADCTLVMPSLRRVRPGVTVLRLARTVPPGG